MFVFVIRKTQLQKDKFSPEHTVDDLYTNETEKCKLAIKNYQTAYILLNNII